MTISQEFRAKYDGQKEVDVHEVLCLIEKAEERQKMEEAVYSPLNDPNRSSYKAEELGRSLADMAYLEQEQQKRRESLRCDALNYAIGTIGTERLHDMEITTVLQVADDIYDWLTK